MAFRCFPSGGSGAWTPAFLCSWLCASCVGPHASAPHPRPHGGNVVYGNAEVLGTGQGFWEASRLLAAWAAPTEWSSGSQCGHTPLVRGPSRLSS